MTSSVSSRNWSAVVLITSGGRQDPDRPVHSTTPFADTGKSPPEALQTACSPLLTEHRRLPDNPPSPNDPAQQVSDDNFGECETSDRGCRRPPTDRSSPISVLQHGGREGNNDETYEAWIDQWCYSTREIVVILLGPQAQNSVRYRIHH